LYLIFVVEPIAILSTRPRIISIIMKRPKDLFWWSLKFGCNFINEYGQYQTQKYYNRKFYDNDNFQMKRKYNYILPKLASMSNLKLKKKKTKKKTNIAYLNLIVSKLQKNNKKKIYSLCCERCSSLFEISRFIKINSV
jgi:hypothetical protein